MPKPTHILLIEDDSKIINFLSLALKAKGYNLTVSKNGRDGLLAFCTESPDIIMLDLGLPDMDGQRVIEEIRKVSDIPVLIVSAREQEEDKISALDSGANDYVTKPFHMGELFARIRVLERVADNTKSETFSEPRDVYQFSDLSIDTGRRRVFLTEEEIHLTPLEYSLLVLLASNAGKVITHKQIMKDVWGYPDAGDTKSIRVCMTSLRRKIEKDTTHPKFVFTEIGVGYRFVDK
ncbi:MAG: response regulator transcription factor [Clostridiales bacterium]|jgi:two-component system KDP operon response regulator KdpE|nr:response regulator transcription factor [Clostridiales bacterium]